MTAPVALLLPCQAPVSSAMGSTGETVTLSVVRTYRSGEGAANMRRHSFTCAIRPETTALSVPVTITQSRDRMGPIASALRPAIARLNAARAERMASSAAGLVTSDNIENSIQLVLLTGSRQ